MVLGAIGVSLTISAQPAWIDDGLVSYYPFDGNADDEGAAGNHLINFNASLSKDRFSRGNRAYHFSSEKLSALVSADDSVYPTGTASRTIAFWVKPEWDRSKEWRVSSVLSFDDLSISGGDHSGSASQNILTAVS